jgi:hypothetical protein
VWTNSSVKIMERSTYSEAYCRSATDQSSSLPRTSALEDTPGNDDSFYRGLLRHHQKLIHGNDGDNFEWETKSTHDRRNHSQRNRSCPKSPRHRSRGSRNSMLGISMSSESGRSTSPASLYPTIIDGTVDNDNVGLTYGQQYDQQYDRLQPSRSGNLFDTSINNHRLEPAAVFPSSPLPCDFNGISAGSTDCTNTATVLLRMSSFYQDALKEAAVIEEDFELPLQKQKQYISLEEERHFSGALDDNDAAIIRTPTTTFNSCGVSESNDTVISASTPITPFYRAALEHATFAEEEELLLLQQHQHKHKRNRQDQDATTIVDTTNTNIYTPSSFYRSALKEAMVAEQELGVQGETGEDEEDAVVSAAVSDAASSIQQRPVAIIVLEPEVRSDFAIEPAANLYERNRDDAGARQSTMRSFSSSSTSSYSNAPSTTGLASPPFLTRAITNDLSPFQLQRLLSDASSSASVVLPIERGAITPDRRTESFVDDSCAFSITRSSVMPHVTNSVLPTTREEADAQATRSDACLFMGKVTFHDSRDLDCSKNVLKDSVDDEIEELQLAIYLSRFESSAASSLNSAGTLSDSLSTGGSRGVSEDDSKNSHFSDQVLDSCSLIENNSEFLTSQFKAMEECQRNNHKKSSPSNRAHGVSRGSSAAPTSDENHFRSLRDTAISSPSSSGERRQTRRRSLLETRGVTETRQAISNSNSHVVKCKGCRGRLQAPVYYSLVFCPKCQTVSPA